MAADPIAGAVMNGRKLSDMMPRQFLSATAEDAHGASFNGSHVYASGNLVSGLYANVAAESTGRVLACRLYEMTDAPGMKEMLSFLIARDTMHQQQWLAVIEELEQPLPVPSDFPQSLEKQEFSYSFFIRTARLSMAKASFRRSSPNRSAKRPFPKRTAQSWSKRSIKPTA